MQKYEKKERKNKSQIICLARLKVTPHRYSCISRWMNTCVPTENRVHQHYLFHNPTYTQREAIAQASQTRSFNTTLSKPLYRCDCTSKNMFYSKRKKKKTKAETDPTPQGNVS